ncbi:hypothetical protein CDL12_02115 [Handroanthus impetiginosus]|uniref:SOSEKI DIX-like domain-containing protein n=1 Tax=Handroanthus impetiginosus TaxID=429701 RepID=A0A2G9I5V2_9LAMI|nr:hypothetical protein CDL12_02115 [Handroanthus impetiginosus]
MEAAEVRRLHIVYFLSRKGHIEHPHLIRVHHLSRNGVRLRDIKRWLGELRGEDMPESYSWSYKRRYKTGYVWQDLLDDDLITPISDNEYVIKGSEITSKIRGFSFADDKVSKQKDQSSPQEDHKTISETSLYISTKSSSEIEEESPTFGSETSTLTDDSGKFDMDKISDKMKQEKKTSHDETEHSTPFYSTFLSKKTKKKSNKVTIDEKISTSTADSSNPSSSETHFAKSKSHSNGASSIFRNLITCGTVETNDSAVVATDKKLNKPVPNMCPSDLGNVHSAEICKRDIFGGSQRVFGTPSWTQQQWSGRKSFDGVKDSAKNELRDQWATVAAYKPINGPNCSQCGKPFKPERLHAHMRSCKGMKTMSKSTAANAEISAAAAAADKKSKATKESKNVRSVSGRLLGC